MFEVLEEAWAEVAHKPAIFLLEIVQFALLAFAVKAVAFGIGKRRGLVQNMLAERRQVIAARLEEANGAEARLGIAQQRAVEVAEGGKAEARRLVVEARREAKAMHKRAVAEGTAEAERLRKQAAEVLDRELEEMMAEVRDELVDVVTKATRRILDEGLSPAEQRALIQRHILEGIQSAETLTEEAAAK